MGVKHFTLYKVFTNMPQENWTFWAVATGLILHVSGIPLRNIEQPNNIRWTETWQQCTPPGFWGVYLKKDICAHSLQSTTRRTVVYQYSTILWIAVIYLKYDISFKSYATDRFACKLLYALSLHSPFYGYARHWNVDIFTSITTDALHYHLSVSLGKTPTVLSNYLIKLGLIITVIWARQFSTLALEYA